MPPNTSSGSAPAMKTVGCIGLGNAGFSIASNLPKAGYNLVVHDADGLKIQRAVSEWPRTIAAHGRPEAFAGCEVIITMLPQGKVVREVLLGKDDIARSLKPELAQLSLKLIDSPITQTYMHATDAGQSTLMVGADSQEAFEKVEPILSTTAGYVFHMGRLGNGHAMKILNNYTMASSLCALSDGLVIGQKYGLDPQQMIDVLNVGTGVCFPTLDPLRRDGLTRRYQSGFGLALLVKDLGITDEFMVHNNFETDLPKLLRRYLSDALQEVEPLADHSKCLVGWEKRSGVQLTRTEKIQDIPAEDFAHRLDGLNRPEHT